MYDLGTAPRSDCFSFNFPVSIGLSLHLLHLANHSHLVACMAVGICYGGSRPMTAPSVGSRCGFCADRWTARKFRKDLNTTVDR